MAYVIKDSQAYLLHQTAREFLLAKTSLPQQGSSSNLASSSGQDPEDWNWRWSFQAAECHRLIASACVGFLNLIASGQVDAWIQSFRSYARHCWILHLRAASLVETDPLLKSASQLCKVGHRDNWILPCEKYGIIHLDQEEQETTSELPNERSSNLAVAAWSGVIALVQTHLDPRTDINSVDVDGRTALSWAAKEGHEDVARLLLRRGAKIDDKALYPDRKPLHEAVMYNKSNMVKLLLQSGAQLDSRDCKGRQPLHCGSDCGHTEIVQILLDMGSNVNAMDAFGASSLQWAASAGHFDVIKLLVDHGARVNYRKKKCLTALMEVVLSSQERCVKFLLESGAEIDLQDHRGRTALIHAVGIGSISMVTLLLKHGASISAKDDLGSPALSHGSFEGHEDVVKLLLEHGAAIDVQDKDDRSALHEAVWGGQAGMVTILLDHGADINLQTFLGLTCLYEAVRHSHISIEITKVLITRGANLGATDAEGRTPALVVCLYGNESLVRLFLNDGLDKDDIVGFAPNRRLSLFRCNERVNDLFRSWNIWGWHIRSYHQGWTLSHCASFVANESLIRYLLSKGANVDAVDDHKHTPLFWAMMACSDDLMPSEYLFKGWSITRKWSLEVSNTKHIYEKSVTGVVRCTFTLIKLAFQGSPIIGDAEVSHTAAQLNTVALLLANGANPKVKGIRWRYKLLPGLRRHKNGRQEMFELLEAAMLKSVNSADGKSENVIHEHLAESD